MKLLIRHIKIQWALVCILNVIPGYVFAESNLENIRFGLHPTYGRIVFDFDTPAPYQVINQEDDNKLYLEFMNCQSISFHEGFVNINQNEIINSIYLKSTNDQNIIIRIEGKKEFQFRTIEMESPWRLIVDIIPGYTAPKRRIKENYYANGVRYLEKHQNELAIQQFHLAIRHNRFFSMAHFQLGQLFQEQNELDKALDHYRQVRERSPVWKEAQANIAKLLQEKIQQESQEKIDLVDENIAKLKLDTNITNSMNTDISDKNNRADNMEFSGYFQSNQSITRILIFAFLLNCILFFGILLIMKKVSSRQKKSKYRKVRGSTKIPKPVLKTEEPQFKKIYKQEIAQQESSQFRRVKPRGEPEQKSFEISEKPVRKVEHAYYRNVMQGTRRVPQQQSQPKSLNDIIIQIEQLSEYNLDVKSIAKELKLGQDEVRMIMNLYQNKEKKQRNKEDDSKNRFAFA